jgi:hypothetical protein
VLDVCLDEIYALALQPAVEVVVEALDVLWVDDDCVVGYVTDELGAHRARLVVACDPGIGSDASPVAEEGMPYAKRLDVWVLGADCFDESIERVGEVCVRAERFPVTVNGLLAWDASDGEGAGRTEDERRKRFTILRTSDPRALP